MALLCLISSPKSLWKVLLSLSSLFREWMSSAWVLFQWWAHSCEISASVHKSILVSKVVWVWVCEARSLAKSDNACPYSTWVWEGSVCDDDVDSVHCLLFKEVDDKDVVGYSRGLCRSQCSYAGVMACVFVDTSCGCPETLVCELSHKMAKEILPKC